MVKIDVKDKKILYQLELDAMQSYSSISKKVGLSREVVNYRIKRLERLGVIDRYVTILNTKKAGYSSFKWYIQFENVDDSKLREIINEFKKHPYCVWIQTCTGRWDLIIVLFVLSPTHFKEITSYFFARYNKYMRETNFIIELGVYHFKKKYIWGEKSSLKKTPYFGGEPEKVKLGKEEIKILIQLCENPKQNIVDIMGKTDLSIDVIKNRLKKMKNNGLIQGSRVEINNAKLGFESYKILLKTKFISKEKEQLFLNYLNHNKNVCDVIHCIGNWDMEINIDVRNSVEFHNVIMEMKNAFSEIIKGYDPIQLFENYKTNFFPMGEYLLKNSNLPIKTHRSPLN